MKPRTAPDPSAKQVQPHLRQPHRPLLLASAIALAAWVVFLLLRALRVV